MSRWGYANVNMGDKQPQITTTDASVAEEVFAALKKAIPSARMSRSETFDKLQVCCADFDRLEGMDWAVKLWIVAKLCDLGWEPFSRDAFSITLRRDYGLRATEPSGPL